jgi:hypothetical protein
LTSSTFYSIDTLVYFFPRDYSMVDGSAAMLIGNLARGGTFELSVTFSDKLREGILGETLQTKRGSFWLFFYFLRVIF